MLALCTEYTPLLPLISKIVCKQSRRIKFNLRRMLNYTSTCAMCMSMSAVIQFHTQIKYNITTTCISYASNHRISPSSERSEIVCEHFVNLNGLKNLSLMLYVDRIFVCPFEYFQPCHAIHAIEQTQITTRKIISRKLKLCLLQQKCLLF